MHLIGEWMKRYFHANHMPKRFRPWTCRDDDSFHRDRVFCGHNLADTSFGEIEARDFSSKPEPRTQTPGGIVIAHGDTKRIGETATRAPQTGKDSLQGESRRKQFQIFPQQLRLLDAEGRIAFNKLPAEA